MNYPNQFNSAQVVVRVLLSTILIAVGVIIALTWSAKPVAAQSLSLLGAITVVGEGKVMLEPDIARVNIGVEVFNNSVADASAENATQIETIISVLK